VARRQPGRLQRAQRAGALELGRAVPRRHAGEREGQARLVGGRDAPQRRERVAAEQGPVTAVEEGDVPGRVARRRDDLERADHVTGREGARRAGLGARVAAPQLGLRLAGIEGLVLGQQARVAGRDEDLDARQGRGDVVERADVVSMGVGQRDPHDRRAELLGGPQDRSGAARNQRVDEGQPVLFGHEVGVDEAEA
jgi:hypothetical protein